MPSAVISSRDILTRRFTGFAKKDSNSSPEVTRTHAKMPSLGGIQYRDDSVGQRIGKRLINIVNEGGARSP